MVKVMNSPSAPGRRQGWISIAAGTAITSVLGASYAYSVYKSFLEALWGSSFWAALPFSVFIAVFALSSIIGGKLYMQKGIKKTAGLSIASVSSGLLLSSLVEYISLPLYLVATYGVLVGLGNGLGYIPVVTLARRWFPDRAGLVTGIIILGYGGSAVAFAPLKTMILQLHGLSLTFVAVGIISLVVGVLAVAAIRDPSSEVTSYYSRFSKKRAVVPKQDLEPSRVIKTLDFWLLWLSFTLVSGAGLMLIGHMASFARFKGLDVMEAALAVSVFSVMNALGRPPAGWISDLLGRYGRPITMTMFFTIQSLLIIALAYAGSGKLELYLMTAALGFTYGSALALYPVATGDFFGLKHLSTNYSLVFTGWGVSGLIFPSIGGYIHDVTGSYDLALVVFGVISLAGALICAYLGRRLRIYLG
ncbi:MAG: OFA family MFS transporter [Thermofilaceae archaeon]